MGNVYFCPECKSKLEELSSCGTTGYFCNACNKLISSKRILSSHADLETKTHKDKGNKRSYPLFSLCGLNCGLCPRFQAKGESKCPGCGGGNFHLKHPTCAVMTCNNKHDNVEYCYQCSSFPCKKYQSTSEVDSFITYRKVISDFEKVKQIGLDQYKSELNEKVGILEFLINNYDDGRRKAFYCNVMNLLKLTDIKDIIIEINEKISIQDGTMKDKINQIMPLFEAKASQDRIELKLRK